MNNSTPKILLLLAALAAMAKPSKRFPDASLYHLTSEWTAEAGERIRLGDLCGKLRLIVLFFGHCEASCPMALGRLKALESNLPKGWTGRAGFVLVTLDPARDDSGSLADFRRRMDLDTIGWTLLRGGREDTRELAMLLGVAYRTSTANGGIEHNSVLALLDAEGVILRRYEGADPGKAFLEDLRNLISGSLH